MSDVDPVVEGKPWAILAYLSILCFIPLIMKRDNPFVLYHAKQGLLLFVGSILFSVSAIIPVIGFIGALGNIAVLVLSIIGIMSALVGKYWKAPVIGKIAASMEF
jgi:fumarate reductase subunit D